MTLQGKGFYIWQVWKCEGGDPNAILAEAQMADLSHVLIKVADGANTYNYDKQRRIDLVDTRDRLLRFCDPVLAVLLDQVRIAESCIWVVIE